MRRYLVIFAIAVGLLVVSTSPAGASRPNMQMKQIASINDGQTVGVVGHHWAPGSTIVGAECNLHYATDGLDACRDAGSPRVAAANGKITMKVFLLKGATGDDGGTCERKCFVVLYEQNDPTTAARERFAFAP